MVINCHEGLCKVWDWAQPYGTFPSLLWNWKFVSVNWDLRIILYDINFLIRFIPSNKVCISATRHESHICIRHSSNYIQLIHTQTFKNLPLSVMLCSTFYCPSGSYSKSSALQVLHCEGVMTVVFCLTPGYTWCHFNVFAGAISYKISYIIKAMCTTAWSSAKAKTKWVVVTWSLDNFYYMLKQVSRQSKTRPHKAWPILMPVFFMPVCYYRQWQLLICWATMLC